MNFREFNRKKNIALRAFKTRVSKVFLNKKNNNRFTPSKLKEIKKILYLRHDNKIGDMIISTLAFREIKKQLPKAKVSVITGPASAQIIENNRNVDNIYLYKKGFFNLLKLGKKLRKEHFDLYIDMDEAPTWQSLLLLRLIAPRYALGFNRKEYTYYNINIDYDFNAHHITQLHQAVFTALRLGKIDRAYDIFVPKALKNKAQKFLDSLPRAKANVIINPFAASKHRALSFEQTVFTANNLQGYNFIIVGSPKDINTFTKGKELPKNLFPAPQQPEGFYYSFALMSQADYVITPDTSIVHAAIAFEKPVLAIYRDGKNLTLPVWGPGPMAKKHIILMGPADLNTLDPQRITNTFLELLKK